MARKKRRTLQERLRIIDERLLRAEEYVAKNVNVEGLSWLHLDDWRGKSGHPAWMNNHAIPAMKWRRARIERALETIDKKAREKALNGRNRRGHD